MAKKKSKFTICWTSLIINLPKKHKNHRKYFVGNRNELAFWKQRRNSRGNRCQTDIQPRDHSCLKIQNILNNHKSLALGISAWPFSHGNMWMPAELGLTVEGRGINAPLHSPRGNTERPARCIGYPAKKGVYTVEPQYPLLHRNPCAWPTTHYLGLKQNGKISC